MSAYSDFVLTSSGISLLNDILSGNGELEFRFLSIGCGIYGEEDKGIDTLRNMSCLKEERQRVSFSNIVKHNKTVELKAHITNQEVTEEYLMTELGIYAAIKGSENEILYCVSFRKGTPDIMPDFSIGRIHDVIFKVQVGIGDVSNISIEYKSGVYALAEDFVNHTTDSDNPHHVTKVQVGLGNVDNTADLDKPVSTAQQAAIKAAKVQLQAAIDAHTTDKANPHDTTKEQVGLGNADNTADADKPVSGPQQAALDELYQQLTAYTQAKIAELINGAPTSMDTLKEVSDAIAAHKSVMDALDAAIGKKANAAEFDSHIKDATKHITTAERNVWNGKQAAIIGGASTIVTSNLTASRALVSDGSGKVAASAVTAAELSRLSGARAGIQGQIDELNTGMTGATTSAAGKAGLVPAPAKGGANRYLRSDGTWQVPPDTNTTYAAMKGATTSATGTAGLVPAPAKGAANRYLRSDGTWQVPNRYSSSSLSGGGLSYGIYKYGWIVEFKVVGGSLTSALTAYKKYTIGTLAEEFRPHVQLSKIICIFDGVDATFTITTAGVVELTPYAVLADGYTPIIHEVYAS